MVQTTVNGAGGSKAAPMVGMKKMTVALTLKQKCVVVGNRVADMVIVMRAKATVISTAIVSQDLNVETTTVSRDGGMEKVPKDGTKKMIVVTIPRSILMLFVLEVKVVVRVDSVMLAKVTVMLIAIANQDLNVAQTTVSWDSVFVKDIIHGTKKMTVASILQKIPAFALVVKIAVLMDDVELVKEIVTITAIA